MSVHLLAASHVRNRQTDRQTVVYPGEREKKGKRMEMVDGARPINKYVGLKRMTCRYTTRARGAIQLYTIGGFLNGALCPGKTRTLNT